MGINKLKVVLTEEAQAFLDAQPFKAQQKIYYNIFKVEEGVMKVDIFKKLENTEIWLRALVYLFYPKVYLSYCLLVSISSVP